MRLLLILFTAAFFTCSNSFYNESLTGHWEGEMTSNGKSIPIIFDISKDKFVYNLPELGLFGQNIEKWKASGNKFTLEVPGRETLIINGTIDNGVIKAEIEDFENTKIDLKKISNEPVFFQEEEVTYKSPDGKLLSGSLLKPNNSQPYPVIIFVHGSGKMTRETMRSRAFMFVQNGIAALIFDRRGKGKSEGDTSRILPIDVMTTDVIAGVEYLKTRADIDKKNIGVYGLSQGAWVAPNAAGLCRDISFLITISAPGITPDEQNDFVVGNIVEKQINKVFDRNNNLKNLINDSALYKYDKNLNKSETEIVPGFSWFNPIPSWEKITIPVLAFWGEKDDIVPVIESKNKIENALLKAGNKNYSIKIFENANHSIRLSSEEEKFAGVWELTAPGSNETAVKWVKEVVKK